MSPVRRLLILSSASLVLLSCRAGEPVSPGVEALDLPVLNAFAANGQANFEEFEVCKNGSAADFSFTVDRAANGPGVDSSGTFSLNDGECLVVTRVAGLGADVAVTETGSASGYVLDNVAITTVTGASCSNPSYSTTTVPGPTASGPVSGSMSDGICDGTLLVFTNVAAPPPPILNGRMTGGGNQVVIGNVRITRGFTIHCDITLSNNIEVNWPGNRWHLDKPITSATCIDDPNVSPVPPDAPFDTFIGAGVGRLNGVDGSQIRFIFVDAGEPGGGNDQAQIEIWDAGGNLVLSVPLQNLTRGNVQAHYDQPHK